MTNILYARVSTIDQNIEIQKQQAEQAGFQIDEVISDHGVSGVSTRLSERSEGKRLFDILRQGDVLIVRWIDRLGRNYKDVTDTIRFFIRKGIIIKTVINAMTFDGSTTDPMQEAIRDALIAFMAAMAQAQAEATKEAQMAGILAARTNEPLKYKGKKPSYDRKKYYEVICLFGMGKSVSEIARETRLSRQTVMRIKNDPVEIEKILIRWNL